MNSSWLERGARRFSRGLIWLPPLWVLAGCGREDIRAYTVPKEKPAAPAEAHADHAGHARPRPQLTWKLPEGWKEAGAGQMSLASFSIAGPGTQEATVSVTPLSQLSGRDAEIVNMWRAQLSLEPLAPEEAAKQFQPVEVAGEKGQLFEVTGQAKDKPEPIRIITVMVHRPDASWFYKLAGDAPLVEAQKSKFIEFLESIKIQESAAPEAASAGASEPAPARMKWEVPSGWQELPPGQMQVAKFSVPAKGEAKAQVFVSVFPGDTGGTLANVNRWRRQLGLGEVAKDGLTGLVSALAPSLPEATFVELSNNNQRLLGAIVPREGRYWFYKLLGDEAAVTSEKAAFIAFAKSHP